MNIFFVILGFILFVNPFIACVLYATFDTQKVEFYRWMQEDPTPMKVGSFIFYQLWPVVVPYMIYYKRKMGEPVIRRPKGDSYE